MTFDISLMERLARLSRLKLTDAEKTKLATELSSILSYVNQLQEMKKSTVEEILTEEIAQESGVGRRDEAKICPAEIVDQIFKNAPASEKGFFKIKAVFD